MAPSKIDVHHHIVPPRLHELGKELRGWKSPEWSIEEDTKFSDSLNIQTRIFSVSTPGVLFVKDADQSAVEARALNEYCASICAKDPSRCGWFATVPALQNTAQAVQEIKHAYDNLHPDGVTLFTSYDSDAKYLGHEVFVPVWEELNARHAVIFVHPCDRGQIAPLFNEHLPGPMFDWPHETGRTAMDLILNRRLQQFPNVKIILSHAGGTLPALVRRATMACMPQFGGFQGDIYEEAKKFYFDTALSGSDELLPLILGFAPKGHLMFGSDYPHGTDEFCTAFTRFLDGYAIDDERREELYNGAAKKLFPRLK